MMAFRHVACARDVAASLALATCVPFICRCSRQPLVLHPAVTLLYYLGVDATVIICDPVPGQVVPDTIWTFEQEQTFAFTNVSTVVRMTVVKLKSGGLFVYAPIAPTA